MQPFQSMRPLAVLLALSLSAMASPSLLAAQQQQTITFASIACTTGESLGLGNTFSDGFFTIVAPDATNDGLAEWCADGQDFAGPGIFVNQTDLGARLTQNDGGAFAIRSIDLAPVFNAFPFPQSVTFTGNRAGGGTITQSFDLPAIEGRPAFQTFTFDPLFSDLSSLDFAPESFFQAAQFTNLVLESPTTTVPEPSSILLMASGLAGIAIVSRRRASRSRAS